MPALLDARGYPRSVATIPGFHRGRVPRNRGRRYPADPPTTEEIIALLRACPDTPTGRRTRALIVVLWRSGLRISEALALEERDLDPDAGSITVRRGKGGKRRVVGMDPWAWTQLSPWLEERLEYPRGPLFCVIAGPTAGRHLSASAVRATLRQLANGCGIRRRIAPHQFRHFHAVELVREASPCTSCSVNSVTRTSRSRPSTSRRSLPRKCWRSPSEEGHPQWGSATSWRAETQTNRGYVEAIDAKLLQSRFT